jgi:hypothetical protein
VESTQQTCEIGEDSLVQREVQLDLEPDTLQMSNDGMTFPCQIERASAPSQCSRPLSVSDSCSICGLNRDGRFFLW